MKDNLEMQSTHLKVDVFKKNNAGFLLINQRLEKTSEECCTVGFAFLLFRQTFADLQENII